MRTSTLAASALLMALICLVPGVTLAATKTHTNYTMSYEITDWSKSCVLPRFDTTLGTLTSAKVTMKGEVQSYLNYENNNTAPRSVNMNIGAKMTYTRLDSTTGSISPVATFTNPSVGARDGVIDYGGTSGFKMGPKSGVATDVQTYTAAAVLSALSGAGSATIPVVANDYMTGDGTANADIVTRTDAKFGCEVEYTYDVPPTPTSAPQSTSTPAPSSTPPAAPTCTEAKPDCVPDLFQIDAGTNYAKLYVNPCPQRCAKVQIHYGRTPDANEYNVEIPSPGSAGVFTYVISDLGQQTKYYFKVKCMGSCTSGDFGTSLGATTASCVTSYYRSGDPQRSSACGTGGSDPQGQVQGASTTSSSVSATPSASRGSVLGAATGGTLAAAGNSYLWMTSLVGSAVVSLVFTLWSHRRSVAYKSRRK